MTDSLIMNYTGTKHTIDKYSVYVIVLEFYTSNPNEILDVKEWH